MSGVGDAAPLAPGPRSLPRTIRGFARDPLFVSLALAREYGGIVRLPFGGYHLISHPDHVQHVMQDHFRNYPGPGKRGRQRSGGLFGRGLVMNEGASWRRQRSLLGPELSAKALPRLVPLFVERTLAHLEGWQAPGRRRAVLDVKSEMKTLARNLIAEALFRSDLRDEAEGIGRAMAVLGDYIDHSVRAWIYLDPRVPTPRNLRFRRAVRALDATLMALVEEERRRGGTSDSLLARLARARDEESGEPMPERQIRDEMVTLFIAGHDTVSLTLSWTLYRLSLHPELRERVEAELETVLGGREPRCEDLDALVYTDRTIREVLRVHPPSWTLIREALAEDRIGGYRVPAGSSLLVSPYLVHHHEDVWENPEAFDPERFSPDRLRGLHKFAWIPFGGGPRVCLGRAIGLAELKVVLAILLQRFRLDLEPGPPVLPLTRISVEPSALRMIVRPR